MTAAGEIELIAEQLLAQAGRASLDSLVVLTGGKNNRVMRARQTDGDSAILKIYFWHPADQRDRLSAEWRILEFARHKGVNCVPQPLARDEAKGAALYTELPGVKLAPDTISSAHVMSAADFIVALNTVRTEEDFPLASEACFSIGQHIEAVERRVDRLADLDQSAPHADAAARFVEQELHPAWLRVLERTRRRTDTLGIGTDDILPKAFRILSPSDFGFHNALAANGNLGFVDFEYAGEDDPAKLVGDFFAVPEIPTPHHTFDGFVEALAKGLSLGSGFSDRARLLRDVYRVKWMCIVLNEFLDTGAARRTFADPQDRNARCRVQLEKSRRIAKDIEMQGDRDGIS